MVFAGHPPFQVPQLHCVRLIAEVVAPLHRQQAWHEYAASQCWKEARQTSYQGKRIESCGMIPVQH
jgi:hypothetical protein